MYKGSIQAKFTTKRPATKDELKANPKATTISQTQEGSLNLQSENRNLMRSLALLCKENKISCSIEVEVKPREVKFKGVE